MLKEYDVSFEEGSVELVCDWMVLEFIMFEDLVGNLLEIFYGLRIDMYLLFYLGCRMFGCFFIVEGGLGYMIIKYDNFDEIWEFYSLLGMCGGIEYQILLLGGEVIEVMFMDCGE